MELTNKQIEEIFTDIVVGLYKKLDWTIVDASKYHSHYKKISNGMMRYEIIKRIGLKEFEELRESRIKHKERRKYYERKPKLYSTGAGDKKKKASTRV